MSETLGEAVARQGVTLVFDRIVALAERDKRIPVGFWVRPLKADWTLTVNGTGETRDNIPPYHASITGLTATGWPIVAIISPAGGNIIGCTEDEILAVLDAALAETEGTT